MIGSEEFVYYSDSYIPPQIGRIKVQRGCERASQDEGLTSVYTLHFFSSYPELMGLYLESLA